MAQPDILSKIIASLCRAGLGRDRSRSTRYYRSQDVARAGNDELERIHRAQLDRVVLVGQVGCSEYVENVCPGIMELNRIALT